MTCIHPPASLSDAQSILVCFGGTHWRELALTGLIAVVLIVLAVTLVLLALRQASGR